MHAPNQQHRTRTLWLIGILHAFTHLYAVALLPLYLYIQRDLKLHGIQEATLIVTVMGLAYFIPSYPLGVLADRISRKRLLTLGVLTNGIGFLLIGLAPNYFWALAGAVVAGFGGSFYHPSATALIAGMFPEARGRALGLVGIGASAGFFFGPLYAGWRAVAAGNWRAPVVELGLFGIAGAALFGWLGQDTPREPRPTGQNASHDRLFPTATLWAFFVGAALLLSLRDFAGSAMATSASLFFQNAHGFNPSVTGLALSGIFAASAISNPLFGGMSDGARMRWLAGLLVAAATLMFMFPRVPAHWSVPVLLSYGFFFMASYPVTEAALMESVPDAVRGRVFGLFITIGGLIGNVAHWGVGDWVRRLGAGAQSPSAYYTLYSILSALVVLSLTGVPFLHGIRVRERPKQAGIGNAALSALRSPEQD